MEVLPSRQNRPFFVTAYIYYVELRRSLIGPSSSLDIMPLSTLKGVGIPQERIVKQPVEVLGFFGGSASFNIRYINFDLSIRPKQV